MIVLQSRVLTAHILPFGATLCGLWHSDHARSLVLGSPNTENYSTLLTYSGAIVGPVANRIARARVQLDGTTWDMERNEGDTCLHCGAAGLHRVQWSVAEQSPTSVTLRAQLHHGAGGLPGNRRFEAIYRVTDDGALTLHMNAQSDRRTMINLAHHPYWNLGHAATVSDHTLRVAADTYLPTNAQNLPTGDIAPVAGTAYDFRAPNVVPIDISLDANLCLARAARRQPQLAAELCAPSGMSLRILTTEPGLQVYNGSGMEAAPAQMHEGQRLCPGAGIALEPQGWPDAPNHSAFASIEVAQGATYRQITEYHISK